MKPQRKGLAILGGAIVTLMIALLAFAAYVSWEASRFQGEIGEGLNRTLGFSHGSPYLLIEGEGVEVFVLYPRPGAIMSRAGVQDGDIVLDYSITEFYRALHERRGSTLNFRVTHGGDGQSVKGRRERSVNLSIPWK